MLTRLFLIVLVLCATQEVQADESESPQVAKYLCFPVGDGCRQTVGYYKSQGHLDWYSKFWKYHLGDDWNGSAGESKDIGLPVYAIGNGVVTTSLDLGGAWGKVVIIRHKLSSGKSVNSFYGHLHKSFVSKGQVVGLREKIGEIGDANGYYTNAAHLHFEIRISPAMETVAGNGYVANKSDASDFVDPTAFIKKRLPPAFVLEKGVKTCSVVIGGQDTGWHRSCMDERGVFTYGEKVFALIGIKRVWANHRFKVWAYRDNALQWHYTTGWNKVDPQWGWKEAQFWPSLENGKPGKWSFYLHVQLENEGWQYLDKAQFAIQGNKANHKPYQFAGAQACGNIGGPSPGWLFWCENEKSVFPAGETIYVLMKIIDVWSDHRFRVRAYKNDKYQWEYTSHWNNVDESVGWNHAFFWPALYNATQGHWRFDLFVGVPNTGFAYVGKAEFAVK